MLSQWRIDELWDFSDPPGSETRLRDAADLESDPVASAELLTQVARSLGLQGRFAEGEDLLTLIDLDDAVVRTRIALELGRLRNSSGDPEAAAPLFVAAAELAAAAGHTFLQVDAYHMLAIVEPDGDWLERALAALAEVSDERTLRWLVSLHNNAGWAHFEEGRYEEALAYFQASKEAAVKWGTPQQVEWAEEAIAETLVAARSG